MDAKSYPRPVEQIGLLRFPDRLLAFASRRPQLTLIALISTIACIVLAGAVFSNRGYPGRDSGIFLYAGQSILEGRVPLKDVWDSKPPGVFFVDALGLSIGRGNVAGVWFVELTSILAAVWMSVKILDRVFGLGPAFFGTMSWLVGLLLLFTTQGTNSIEEYAIPLKFAAFWLFLECESRGYRGRRGFALGATGALALLLRQNLIGALLAVAFYMLVTRAYRRNVRRLLTEWFWVGVGGMVVLGVVLAYYAANSALGDLIDAAFRYNMLYSAATLGGRLGSVIVGFGRLSRSGLGVIAIASWIVALASLRIGPRHGYGADARRLTALALIAFPVEIVLTSVSTRGYGHYYEAWLPAIGILAGFFASWMGSGWTRQRGGPANWRSVGILAAILIGMASLPAYGALMGMLPLARDLPMSAEASVYVRSATNSDDYVLVWGIEPAVNFLAQRRAPSKFIFQYPLFTPGYSTPDLVNQFLADLEAHPPALIVDMSSATSDAFPPIDDARRANQEWTKWGPNEMYGSPPGTDQLFAYLNEHYVEKDHLFHSGRTIYMYARRPPVGRK